MNTTQRWIIAWALVAVFVGAMPDQSQCFAQHPGGSRADVSMVNATTIMLVQLKPADIRLTPWLQGENAPVRQGDVDARQTAVKAALAWLKNVSGTRPFYLSADIPYTHAQPVVRMMVSNPGAQQLDTLREQLSQFSTGEPVVDGDFVVVSPSHALGSATYQLDHNIMPPERQRFEPAAQEVADFPMQVLIAPPGYLWDTFDELLPQLPDQFGGGATSVVTQGVRWIALGIDPSKPEWSVTIQSDDPQAAAALAGTTPKLLEGLIALVPEPLRTLNAPFTQALLQSVKTDVVQDQVHVSFESLEAPANLLASVAEGVAGPLSRAAKKNRMREIVLGVLNYESANGSLPPGPRARNEDGTSNLSWRVHILPYLGQSDLYSKFRLDEPWDSPNNMKLLEQMPDVFSAYASNDLTRPRVTPGYTTFLAPVGKGTIFGGREVTKLGDIEDGTSRTLALVEVNSEQGVPWTAPQDYRFDPEDPGAGLAWGVDAATGVMACDGAWHLLSDRISKQNLVRLFQMNDGELANYE